MAGSERTVDSRDVKPVGFDPLLSPTTQPVDRRDRHEMLGGAVASFASKFGSSAVQYLYTVLLARTLGTDATGAYFLAVTVTMLWNRGSSCLQEAPR